MIPPDVDQAIGDALDALEQLFGSITTEQEVEAWETIIEYAVLAMQGLTSSG